MTLRHKSNTLRHCVAEAHPHQRRQAHPPPGRRRPRAPVRVLPHPGRAEPEPAHLHPEAGVAVTGRPDPPSQLGRDHGRRREGYGGRRLAGGWIASRRLTDRVTRISHGGTSSRRHRRSPSGPIPITGRHRPAAPRHGRIGIARSTTGKLMETCRRKITRATATAQRSRSAEPAEGIGLRAVCRRRLTRLRLTEPRAVPLDPCRRRSLTQLHKTQDLAMSSSRIAADPQGGWATYRRRSEVGVALCPACSAVSAVRVSWTTAAHRRTSRIISRVPPPGLC